MLLLRLPRRKAAFTRPASIALLLAFLVAAPASLCAYGQQDVHATLVPKADRKPATPFHLVDTTGKTIQVSDFRNKVVLLNFWATHCGGCILEIPSFIELQQAHAKSGFTAVGISADIPYEGLKGPAEAWALVRPFISSHKLNYPILMGDAAIIDAYGFPSYPATYLLDRSGRVAATYVGVVNKADVDTNIKTLLNER